MAVKPLTRSVLFRKCIRVVKWLKSKREKKSSKIVLRYKFFDCTLNNSQTQ